MASTIIELKEQYKGTKKNTNLPVGVWDTVIEPQKISEGDTIAIRSGFLDTVASNGGSIKIDDTNNVITLSYVLMVQNYNMRAKVLNGWKTSLLPVLTEIDNQAYTLSETVTTSPGSYINVSSINWYRNHGRIGNYYGFDAPYSITYKTLSGGIGHATGIIPHTHTEFTPIRIPVSFIALEGSLVKVTPTDHDMTHDAKVERWDTTSSSYTPAGTQLVHKEFTHQFTLPTGNFEFAHLARILTDKLTDINNRDHSFETPNPASNNAFLWDNTQLTELLGENAIDGGSRYVSEDGLNVIQLPNVATFPATGGETIEGFADGVYTSNVGTSEIAILFDDDLQKFKIEQIHSNIYSDGTEILPATTPPTYNQDGVIIATAVNQKLAGDGINTSWNGRNGCIAFTDMQPHSLFFTAMGLNPLSLVTYENALSNVTVGALTSISTERVKGGLQNGLHTTTGLVGVNGAISKNINFFKALSKNGLQVATADLNSTIYGLGNMNAPTDDIGYFQIAVGGWRSNVITEKEDEGHCIKAIVSRYFTTTSSYTSFNQEGNCGIYQHTGSPFYLNNIRVRVLKPDYSLASEVLNSDNTIYLEIVRKNENTIENQIN